jgi:hypothetical protein
MDIALLILTHSDYNDLHEALFDRLKKHLKINFAATYLCADMNASSINFDSYYDFNQIFYFTDEMSYPNRMKEALSVITQKYVLIYHDNNILIDDTDIEGFNNIEQVLYRDAPDQLRLHAGSARTPGIHIERDIYKMLPHDDYKYSVYPTIWKKTSIMKIFEMYYYCSYREIECAVQGYVGTLTNYYVWNLDKCPPVGHCASEITPHILKYAHCTIFRQWPGGMHTDALIQLKKDYNIDFSKRGFHKFPCFNGLLPDAYSKYKNGHTCVDINAIINTLI